MNSELQAIKNKWAEKTAAKERALAAMGEAYLAERDGRTADAGEAWARWQVDGIQGAEKALADEQLEMCKSYVEAHSDEFEKVKDLTIEECVSALSVFRAAGYDEDAQRLEVWLRYHFEPQHIGGPMQARVRLPFPGGKK